jgi:hypothetical protein
LWVPIFKFFQWAFANLCALAANFRWLLTKCVKPPYSRGRLACVPFCENTLGLLMTMFWPGLGKVLRPPQVLAVNRPNVFGGLYQFFSSFLPHISRIIVHRSRNKYRMCAVTVWEWWQWWWQLWLWLLWQWWVVSVTECSQWLQWR